MDFAVFVQVVSEIAACQGKVWIQSTAAHGVNEVFRGFSGVFGVITGLGSLLLRVQRIYFALDDLSNLANNAAQMVYFWYIW